MIKPNPNEKPTHFLMTLDRIKDNEKKGLFMTSGANPGSRPKILLPGFR